MNAVELFHKDGKNAGIYYCSKCKLVKANQEQAEKCCKCYTCGVELSSKDSCSKCNSCWQKDLDKWEKDRFDKATKIKLEDYAGKMIYDGDIYHETEDYLDFAADEDWRPEYVWGVKVSKLKLLNSDSYEEYVSEQFEDGYDALKGLEELNQAMKKFNELNSDIELYNVDYSIAILMPSNERLTKDEV